MKKEMLLAKSNIRKGKGLAIGLILLITLASCFLNLVLFTFKEFNTNATRTADRLNCEDASVFITGDTSNIDDKYIKSKVDPNKVQDFETKKMINLFLSTVYASGNTVINVLFSTKDDVLDSNIGKTEIVEEDKSIKDNYIYLPYQYHTGGNINIGDKYELKISGKTYNFNVKGFHNNVMVGSTNNLIVLFITDNYSYNEIYNNNKSEAETLYIKFDLKPEVNQQKFINEFSSTIAKENKSANVLLTTTLDSCISNRTFFAKIMGVSCLAISIIILIVVFLMLSNNISNYIKENIKTLGAIKAIGYTSKNIKVSFLVQFLILSTLGNALGILLSHFIIPFVSKIMNIQIGIPYTITSNQFCTAITITAITIIVAVIVIFFVRKIDNIQPITALKDGIQTHNFKKNRIQLEKTKLPLNTSLALKTMFTNMRQNITTFIITFFLIFSGVIGLMMYQNLSVKVKLSLFTFETFGGAVIAENDSEEDVLNKLKSMDEIYNIRLVSQQSFDVEDAKITIHIIDSAESLNNKDVCYTGRLPKYDNEIAMSGKFCSDYGYKLGDEIEVRDGNKKGKYLITGLIQSFNESGQEAVLLKNGAEKLLGDRYPKMYAFDVKEGVNAGDCLNEIKKDLGNKVSETINFQESEEGFMSSFKTLSKLLVTAILAINTFVILLVLYLLIKTLINNKKRDYGILKAIGYTSRDVIKQNAISYMPSIILAVTLSCIISCFIANPFLTTILNSFGIMKLTFDIPYKLVAVMGIGFIAISFIFSILLSLKIRKIEAYNLLKGE